VAELQAQEWARYGKHRLYVNAPDGTKVGWVDLTTGGHYLDYPYLREQFEATVETWQRSNGRAFPAPRQHLDTAAFTDLAGNRAGAAAREQARRLRAERPVRTILARLMGVHTDERAWRIGAGGEEVVGRRLTKLSDEWRVLHAVPVGDRGSDIDHIVIGPGGVYTLNTKTHPDADIWVAGNQFRINNRPEPYLHKSRHEAERAARLLSAAARRPVAIQPLIVVVGARKLTVREEARGVVVLTERDLVLHLQTEPRILSPSAVEAVYSSARRAETWASRAGAGS
jgi:hypothetical protein